MYLQYITFSANSKYKLNILLGLANNCELEAAEGDSSLREQAAEYRQQLFVEMIDQDVKVPVVCAGCNQVLHAHEPSECYKGSKVKMLVTPCFHLYHKGCLQEIDEDDGCVSCHQQLGLAKRTLH